ncbi:MAG: flagellar biosynthetic protein FliR, partial [Oscillospiraceae bacterium]
MYFEELMDNYQTYLLVFARVMGIFVYNPIFSRKNIPTYIKIGASIALTLVIGISLADGISVGYDSAALLGIAFVREGIIGFILGFITQMFLSALLLGGEMMDNQSGLGMAKVYDASSGVQMPIFGTVSTYMFIIYFFVTDCHFSYIKIFAVSYDFIPIQYEKLNPQVFMVIVEYFGTVLTLAVKLAMPLVVAELILEFCMGILMKAV